MVCLAPPRIDFLPGYRRLVERLCDTTTAAAALTVVLTLGGCAGSNQLPNVDRPQDAATTHAAVQYQKISCDSPYHNDPNVECGSLSVPQRHRHDRQSGRIENRQATNRSRTLTIPVLRLFARRHNGQRNPMVILGGGGPGAPIGTNGSAIGRHKKLFSTITDSGRDVIIVEQRGVGRSEPSTFCHAGFDFLVRVFSAPWNHSRALEIQREGTVKCRGELTDRGVDIGAYTNRESVADIEALRTALNIEKWVIFGGSAAASLALDTLRHHGAQVEAAILDSPSPPEHHFLDERYRIYDDAFRKMLAACAQNARCARAYPDLGASFRRVLSDLRRTPVVLSIENPVDRQPMSFVLDADRLLDLLFFSLYWPDALVDIPRLIAKVDSGQPEALIPVLNGYVDLFANPDWGDGLWLSVQCREKLPFSRKNRTTPSGGMEFYPLAFATSIGDMHTLCEAWQAGEPIVPQTNPIQSSTPTLILSGEFDPITPTRIARAVHRRLPGSQLVVFNAAGHSVTLTDECALEVVATFLKDPKRRIQNDCVGKPRPLMFSVDGEDN